MAEATMPKGEFASLIGVSAARVSQYISEGKIGPDALVGEGRNARVLVDLACRQISARRDLAQAMGNGIDTRLGAATSAEVPPAQAAPSCFHGTPAGAPPASNDPLPSMPVGIDDRYKLEKLRAIQSANRKAAEDEERRVGRFTDTADARAQMSRIAASMLQSFDGVLPAFASAIAAKFSVPQRDVLHLLRHEFREHRMKAAIRHQADADALPETVESIVVTEEGTLQ